MFFAVPGIDLKFTLSGAVATSQLPITGCWAEITKLGVMTDADAIHTVSADTTEITLIAAPAASHIRKLQGLSVPNVDTAEKTIIIYQDSGTERNSLLVTLAVGDVFTVEDSGAWSVHDSVGNVKTSVIATASTEDIQDAIGPILADTDTLDLTYDDATPSITGITLAKPNLQTGTTYTYVTGDRGKLVTHSNVLAVVGTLPQAGASFPNGWYMDVQNRGVGTLTITPTTSTIDGAATLALVTNTGVRIFSDGTNYYTQRGAGVGGGAALPVIDTTSIAKGSADDTKQVRFEVDGFTTGTTRVITPLDKDYTLEETGHQAKHIPGGSDPLQFTAASRLFGRGDGGAGDVQEIVLGTNLSITGTTLNATGGSGDVIGPASSVDNTLAVFSGTTGKIIKDDIKIVADADAFSDPRMYGTTAQLWIYGGADLNDQLSLDANIAAASGVANGVIQIGRTAEYIDFGGFGTYGPPITRWPYSGFHTSLRMSVSQAVNIDYTWPSSAPAANGYVLSSTTAGVWSWVAQDSSNSFATIAVSGQSDVVADSSTDTLTLVAGTNIILTTVAGTDTITITSAVGGSGFYFKTIAVSGQDSVEADSADDAVVFAAGTGIAITTNAATDTVTIAATGSASNSFETIAVSGQANVVADSSTDTLTFIAGANIAIVTDSGTDSVSFAVTNVNCFSSIIVSGQATLDADSISDSLTLIAGANISLVTDSGPDSVSFAVTGINSFSTILVSGQATLDADSPSDSLTLVAGSGIALVTDSGNDSITISATGSASNSFETIAVSGQSSVVADSATDTLTLVAGANVTITTDAGTDTITIAASADSALLFAFAARHG